MRRFTLKIKCLLLNPSSLRLFSQDYLRKFNKIDKKSIINTIISLLKMKRLFDFFISFLGILILMPIFIITTLLIFLYDFQYPLYNPQRMGKNMKAFTMIKFRSMIKNADKTGVNSTSIKDVRITPIGKIIRKFKIDELSQLFNVFRTSFVGPRPQIINHVINEYTEFEKLLTVKPGITDFSSIVFSDEETLKNSKDPDADYNLLIRPWKSKLGLLYVENQSLLLDFYLIVLTLISIINKP